LLAVHWRLLSVNRLLLAVNRLLSIDGWPLRVSWRRSLITGNYNRSTANSLITSVVLFILQSTPVTLCTDHATSANCDRDAQDNHCDNYVGHSKSVALVCGEFVVITFVVESRTTSSHTHVDDGEDADEDGANYQQSEVLFGVVSRVVGCCVKSLGTGDNKEHSQNEG